MLLIALAYFAVSATVPSLPPGKGKAIVLRNCKGCHAMKVVTSKRATKQQWSALVNQMIGRGAEVDDDEVETVVDYLAKNFGLTTTPPATEKNHDRRRPVNVNQATAAELAAALGLSTKESDSIVLYRKQNGNFKEWRDLTKVPGVEASKIMSNKDRLVF